MTNDGTTETITLVSPFRYEGATLFIESNPSEGFWIGGPLATNLPCLITAGEVEDVFNDTYRIDLDTYFDTVTRVTPCRWTGAKTGGGTWTLDYGITTPYKWHLSSSGGAPTSADKDDPQDGPEGEYDTITVTV